MAVLCGSVFALSDATLACAAVAALIELASEPLYILAQVHFKVGLRVSIEAAAVLCKILSTIVLLWLQIFSEAVSLSLAQVTVPILSDAYHLSIALHLKVVLLADRVCNSDWIGLHMALSPCMACVDETEELQNQLKLWIT